LNSSDIWSLGCTIVEMLTGNFPWKEFNLSNERLIDVIKETKSGPIFPEVSPNLKNFILKCFILNPHERPTAIELLSDPFMNKSESEKRESDIMNSLTIALKC